MEKKSSANAHAELLNSGWGRPVTSRVPITRCVLFRSVTVVVAAVGVVGATMYGTLFPCADCARAIVAAGLSRLVVLGLDKDPMRDAKWLEHYRYAERILAMAGVAVEIIDPKEITAAADQR
jgi:deoxycytidylate deaminase